MHDQQAAQLTARVQAAEREGAAQVEAYQSLMQQLEGARAAASSSEKRTRELEEVRAVPCRLVVLSTALRRMNGWLAGSVLRRMNGWLAGSVLKRMNGWLAGSVLRRMNGLLAGSVLRRMNG